ncbi:hypothetical protein [Micromonospora sp. NPDC003776]
MLIDDGQTSLVTSVRRGNLNRSVAAARAPLWEQTSDLDRFRAFGDFHQFMEWEGYYGEQRYDGIEARYNLMEYPYTCNPVTKAEHAALAPVLQAARQVYDLAHCPIWATMDRATTGTHRMKPVQFRDTDRMIVEQDDEARRGPLLPGSRRPVLRAGLVLLPRLSPARRHRHLPRRAWHYA